MIAIRITRQSDGDQGISNWSQKYIVISMFFAGSGTKQELKLVIRPMKYGQNAGILILVSWVLRIFRTSGFVFFMYGGKINGVYARG